MVLKPILSIVAAVLLAGACVLLSCSDHRESEAPTEQEGRLLPDQIISGFGLTMTADGVKKTHVDAREAFVFEETDRVEAIDLTVRFFTETGEYYSRLEADSGSIDMETNDMRAIGNVVVVSSDSLRLETHSLFWDDDEEQISTEDSVVFYQEDQVVRGRGMYSDPGLEDVVILEPTGRFKEKDREKDGRDTDE